MTKYLHEEIELKWQKRWADNNSFACPDESARPKYYVLEMFPYPSGKIHMGHVRNYSIGDVVARFKRMQGYNVLHPMGWDAFGLPAENAAIKNNVHPAKWTYSNIDTMREQLQRLGYSYDWARELATCHPDYYKWEQGFFLKLLEKGLAYRKEAPQNWCPSCNTVLANEQVIDGLCWRCDSQVEQKDLTQWFVRITAYAEELLADLEKLEGGWPERVISMQRNWIGKSHGAEINFKLKAGGDITVFTTRPDTIFGATFMSIAPEHPLLETFIKDNPEAAKIRDFARHCRNMDRIDRTAENQEKEGMFTGAYCVNPFTGEDMPIWVANFVLMDYGTGAVMAVPAHDQRDFDFARKYKLPVRVVIEPKGETLEAASMTEAMVDPGVLVNSGDFTGLDNEEAKGRIAAHLESKGRGKSTINWRLRDWNISRQRYWGAPIPVIYCPACGAVPEKEENLPVLLPLDVQTRPDGRSPLPETPSFVNCACPKCGAAAKRETDTMDTFVESSWYFARYTAPRKEDGAFDKAVLKYWMPVDQYIGGVEHAILHLLYSRFFSKALRDLGYVEFSEPFANLLTQGMVLKDGSKMSKSRGNTVDPTEMIERYGADTVRLFCLFAAPPERDFDWSESGIEGSYRFLGRVWRLISELKGAVNAQGACSSTAADVEACADEAFAELRRKEHSTVKKAGEDIVNRFQFNTAIAGVMELVNTLHGVMEKQALSALSEPGRKVIASAAGTVLTLLAPFTPHLCEELWQSLGGKTELYDAPWPSYEESALKRSEIELVVQVNGKLRARIKAPAEALSADLEALALNDEHVKKHLAGLTVRKVLVVPGKLVNVVAN